jgi:hypothetical protein
MTCQRPAGARQGVGDREGQTRFQSAGIKRPYLTLGRTVADARGGSDLRRRDALMPGSSRTPTRVPISGPKF